MQKVTFTVHGSTPMTFDIDVEAAQLAHAQALSLVLEQQSQKPSFNFGKFLAAAVQLFIAFTTGNVAGIAAAIQALIAAITGP